MSRAAETLASIPLATRAIMGLCISTYIFQLVFDPPLHNYTMCPRQVLYLHEYYRFVTSALFHGGMMHIAMNILSTMAIGSNLERQIGTLMLGVTILWGILLTSAIYVFVAWMLYLILGYEKMMNQHSLGFSGVIFQLSVLESSLSPNRVRSVFGVLEVSSRMYPWALLVVLQFVMPHISFLGHLSGILAGTLQHHGAFDAILPSDTYLLQECETWDNLGFIRRQPGYVSTPETGLTRGERPRIRTAVMAACASVALFASNVCEAIKVIIFGRGSEANANIQLGDLSAAWGSSDANTQGTGTSISVEDDEEWVGLPEAIQRSTEEL